MRAGLAALAALGLAACQHTPVAGEGAVFQGIVIPAEDNGAANLYADGRMVHPPPTFGIWGSFGPAFEGSGYRLRVDSFGSATGLSLQASLPGDQTGQAPADTLVVSIPAADGRQQTYSGTGTVRLNEIVPLEPGMDRIRATYDGRVCTDGGRCLDVAGAFAFTRNGR
jgi:hypothetical protein